MFCSGSSLSNLARIEAKKGFPSSEGFSKQCILLIQIFLEKKWKLYYLKKDLKSYPMIDQISLRNEISTDTKIDKPDKLFFVGKYMF